MEGGTLQRQEEKEETAQGKFTAQMKEEEETAQGKFTVQMKEEEETAQGKFTAQMKEEEETAQGKVQGSIGPTGIPVGVQDRMENSFNTDFSEVRVHTASAKATEVGALAYTRGNDVHFAPGNYKPETEGGRSLLGHELTHVKQQREGRVEPTTEIGGMPLNNDPSLEKEADDMGHKAVT
ncbi:MAG: DUF4157 domain-containing protein [bacterium]|nr:DUF4157 domain-containing protein [bacterium]